ncbi:MAG: hypothetical protein F4129_02395 [Acidimicrobiia bacterium]|uniref:hypothetical protein n=1 Tax=Candidatus Poriferisocius sp. TaxID=3101276 RepID=UPI0013615768|nr:hypothetical protein [Acidimicrobiia bacterium]MYL08124.1 hypothetical protein [Acidimicrobiia bacterium]
MIELQPATLLVQLAVGGLAFTWLTTRRRETGLGYGWLMRSIFGLLAAGGAWLGFATDSVPVRDWTAAATATAAAAALAVSVVRRRAGVSGQRERVERRSAEIAEMTGIDREEQRFDRTKAEFPPILDLIAPAVGLIGVVAGGLDAGDPAALAVARTVIGAFFLGAVTDAMLLGHWYLVQPGLARGPLLELVRWTGLLWLPELVVMLWPTGMGSVLSGTIDDGYNGLLGWFWVACVVTTAGLVVLARAALRERFYSAVMAATGLLYLGILTGFGMDLVARVLLDTT